MKFGLSDRDVRWIALAIANFEEIEKACVSGSRAKGNYRPGSDIDIAIYGNGIDLHTVSRLHAILEEESPMPYFFDVVDATHLTHPELRAHIERVGQVIFDRN